MKKIKSVKLAKDFCDISTFIPKGTTGREDKSSLGIFWYFGDCNWSTATITANKTGLFEIEYESEKERLSIYEEVREYVRFNMTGICAALEHLNYGKITDYPELMTLKPSNTELHIFWFDTHEERLEALDKLILEIEEKSLTYSERQARCGIKVGDTVRVLRKAEHGENGWQNGWTDHLMGGLFGKEATVTGISDSNSGFQLNNMWFYPYFVLEKVTPKKERYEQCKEYCNKLKAECEKGFMTAPRYGALSFNWDSWEVAGWNKLLVMSGLKFNCIQSAQTFLERCDPKQLAVLREMYEEKDLV